MPTVRAVHDGTVAAARSGLGDDAFAAAWADGQGLSLEQAVAYALEEPAQTPLGRAEGSPADTGA
jgi:non-specific serine/threonine protein kinase